MSHNFGQNCWDICASLGPHFSESDYHLISPYNFSLESNIEVMRIKELITN